MQLLNNVFFCWPIILAGMPLFTVLSMANYFPIEEKYKPIRPNDVFVPMALCGWLITCSIIAAIIIWILTNIFYGFITLIITSIAGVALIRVTTKLILNCALNYELKHNKQNTFDH